MRFSPSSRNLLTFCALLLITLVCLPWFLSLYIAGMLTIALYFSVFTMSWDLLFGYSGEVNFGPTFLIGIGAYAAALLNVNAGLPVFACVLLGTLTAVLAGLLLVAPALRLRGPYFCLITLVSVLVLQEFITIFAQYTGGEIGMTLPGVLSASGMVNYYLALALVCVSAGVFLGITSSPVGLILQAGAQDPVAAESLGFNIVKYKVLAFSLSAFFSGLSGAMLVFYMGTASVSIVVSVSVILQIIIAAIIGGRRTIVGPILGSLFIIITGQWLQYLGQLDYAAVAILALIILLFFPDGIAGIILRRH
ncbi:MAG: branched-chain amino acid ABC transporter permease [Deltaproteobacteria bacterium]|nr:branched-chain amino acid ABC transporter permease [Deltaproteobacteria bacterium]